MQFDGLDLEILSELQQDVTLPLAELAERVGSSKSVCWRRIQQYLEHGIIRDRVAVLDAKALGLGVTIFAQVKMDRHEKDVLPKFVKAIKEHPEVVECHSLTGSVDFLLKIVVRDVEEYERFFWSDLSKIENVREVNSAISLTKFVETTHLPLSHIPPERMKAR